MQNSPPPVRWLCPHCGEVTQCVLHSGQVKQQKTISIKPILPTCIACGAEVRLCHAPVPRRDARLLALTGTCASGKSTIAEVLVARYGFSAIDGNNVMDVIRHKSGVARVAFNGTELLKEIEDEIDMLLALQQDIVLAHVIIPDDLPRYRRMFRSRGLHYKLCVLQPEYAAAVTRSRTRTSFQTLTDETWVRHFHQAMMGFQPDEDVLIFVNTACSAEESAEKILRSFGSAPVSGAP